MIEQYLDIERLVLDTTHMGKLLSGYSMEEESILEVLQLVKSNILHRCKVYRTVLCGLADDIDKARDDNHDLIPKFVDYIRNCFLHETSNVDDVIEFLKKNTETLNEDLVTYIKKFYDINIYHHQRDFYILMKHIYQIVQCDVLFIPNVYLRRSITSKKIIVRSVRIYYNSKIHISLHTWGGDAVAIQDINFVNSDTVFKSVSNIDMSILKRFIRNSG
jgi:hypothetical protein